MSLVVGRMWDSYARLIVPANAGPVQIQETRRAFYAGAQCIFHHLVNAIGPEQEPTEADIEMMNALAAELDAFALAVRDGKA
jgi:hypothetical protein